MAFAGDIRASSGLQGVYYNDNFDFGFTRSGEIRRSPRGFSFADTRAVCGCPWYKGDMEPYFDLQPLSVLAISENRPKYPVTSMGHQGVRGFTRGIKTTAGSLGFNSQDRNPLWPAIMRYYEMIGGTGFAGLEEISVTDIPPVNIILVLENDEGDNAYVSIRFVEFIDSSLIIDSNMPNIPNTYSFVAHSASTFMGLR